MALLFSHLFSPAPAHHPSELATVRPGHTMGEEPEGAYFLAAALVGSQHPVQAAPLLRRLATLTGRRADRHQWGRRVEFLWAMHAERTADPSGVLNHCQAADLARGCGDVSPGSSCQPQKHGGFLQSVDAIISEQLPLLAARAHIRLGETQRTQAWLENRFGDQANAEENQPAIMAMLACYQGRLSDADRLAKLALQAVQTQCSPTEPNELDARLILAEVFFERNQLDAAQAQLETGLRRCSAAGATQWMWTVEADLVRVMIAQGHVAEALHRLDLLRRLLVPDAPAHPLLRKLNQSEVDARVALGDLDGALQLARSLPPQDLTCETLARLDLASGRPDRALTRLKSAGAEGAGPGIRRLILRACAEKQEGRMQRAESAIRRALELGRLERYVRPFLEVPTLTVPLLCDVMACRPDAYASELISQGKHLVSTGSLAQSGHVLEPLTERESQVLRYLPSHLNKYQIATLMCLSANTVKTHVSSIYRKIGATSRDDAVTIARSHGLL